MKVELHDDAYIPGWKQISYLYIPALYLLTAVLLDVVMYAFMGVVFPPQYIYSFVLMLVVAALVSLTRRKWLQTTILSIFLGMQLFTCIANIISYTTLFEVFSLETILSIVNAFDAAESIELNLWFIVPICLVMALYVVGVILIHWRCRVPKVRRRRSRLWQAVIAMSLLVVCLFCETTAYLFLVPYKSENSYVQNLRSSQFIYDTFNNRVISLKTFGSYSFYFDNLLYLLSLKTAPAKALNIKVVTEFQPDDTDYDQIEQLGAGDNLIMVLMETFEQAAINPITMPNLWQFMQESCTEVDGYHSMERTCFTDYISQTGMQVLGKEMWSGHGKVEIPFSLANLFNQAATGDDQYVTSAFHNSKGSFYARNTVFTKSLGFQNFYDYTVLSEQHNNHCAYNKDELLFKENIAAGRLAPADRNFFNYLISVSTHSTSPNMDMRQAFPEGFEKVESNLDELADTYGYHWLKSSDRKEQQVIKNYLAGTYSFDLGFGALLEHLKTTDDLTNPGKKLIETTAIVMFGDHYYYTKPDAVKPEYERPQTVSGNRCPFIIYNPYAVVDGQVNGANAAQDEPAELGRTIANGKALHRFASTMDIYKTVCSLFGVVTDQQLTYGHSVLSSEQSIGVGYINGYTWGQVTREFDGTLVTANWRTADFKTFTFSDSRFKTLTDEEMAWIEPLVTRTYQSIIANTLIYQKNGFKKLNKCYQYKII